MTFAALIALPACGVSYTSPKVDTDDESTRVTVVEIIATSVAEANRSKYSPKTLPKAFSSVAGGGSFVGAGALPNPPYVPSEQRNTLAAELPPEVDATPYRIGVGDVVLLATRGSATTVEQLSGLLAAQNSRQGYTVRDDGAIAIPEIGPVSIAGMTLREAEDALFQVLIESQIDPSFSLEIAEFNSQRVTVGGAVSKPALVPIGLNAVTLGEALIAAGGLDVKDEEFASIRIYRDGSLYQIPVENYLTDSDLRNRVLVNGDAVFVDLTYDLDRALEFYKQQIDVISLRGTARGTALSALTAEIGIQRAALEERRRNFEARAKFDAEDRDYVYLAGEVEKQSRVALPYNRQATLADVLYGEGGFDNTTGDPSEIYVLRVRQGSEAGTITAYHLNIENAAKIVFATQMQMRPNDIVFIEEQPITKWSRSLQQLFPAILNTAGRAVN
ncbi:Polysaccharide export lipoprotein Wza [Candidatus Rhodobacter oscarellae]|uniref:Polysaccharide export lipoprotein Wza n=1 Tax=Candidatus Rhodobacter oscarellae TaxID=1675527 RepID=A0A0J9EAN1_9RHOB|nr:polysaccharide biosynthesis/export family protein [Candidatus Rhodobacter lobularis]KMW59850.1 Polysaccharide export lipoprotein Wza [Candidatus Rhodobacter lobularis]